MNTKTLERFPEGVLEYVAKTISNYRTGSEIGEILRIAGYPSQSLVQGTKWRFLYETFKQFQTRADGQYHIAKVIQEFCVPTQWIGESASRLQALERLNEGLMHVSIEVNTDGKLVVAQKRIPRVVKEETRDETSEPMKDDGGPNKMTNEPDPRRVFVIYGRNERVRREVFLFLLSIGLEPIEWTKAILMTGKAAPFVGEVLDVALGSAQAIVVVMTPDDEARLRKEYLRDGDPAYEGELTPQPRPNVLFEAGLALGRAPNRTIFVEVGHTRPFSDIAGRHTIRLNNSTERRQELASRLKLAGCSVDLDGTDWHSVGNFEIREIGGSEPTQAPANVPRKPVSGKATEVLTKDEVDILRGIAEDNDPGTPVHWITEFLSLSQIRVEYLLERLEKGEYIYGSGEPPKYYLDSKGRAYLVEHDLV